MERFFYGSIAAGMLIPYYKKSIIKKGDIGISMQQKGRVLGEGFHFRIPWYEEFYSVEKTGEIEGTAAVEINHNGSEYVLTIDKIVFKLNDTLDSQTLYEKIFSTYDDDSQLLDDWVEKLSDEKIHQLIEYYNHRHLDSFLSNDITEISKKDGWFIDVYGASLWKPL